VTPANPDILFKITFASRPWTTASIMTLHPNNVLYAKAVMDSVPVVFFASTQFSTALNTQTAIATAMNVPRIP
jgi:hypothetical protein